MAWTTPRTWTVGEFVTKLIMDTHIRDNFNYLKTEADSSPVLVGRQGGSATDWNTGGTTNYTPTSTKMQAGVSSSITLTLISGSLYGGSVVITFPTAFSNKPIVLATALPTGSVAAPLTSIQVSSISTTQATLNLFGTSAGLVLPASWVAIGI